MAIYSYSIFIPLLECKVSGVPATVGIQILLLRSLADTWDGENMLNPLLQSHPVFIPMESLAVIWDFRLRILDLWNRYALSIYNRPNSLIRHSTFDICHAGVSFSIKTAASAASGGAEP